MKLNKLKTIPNNLKSYRMRINPAIAEPRAVPIFPTIELRDIIEPLNAGSCSSDRLLAAVTRAPKKTQQAKPAAIDNQKSFTP
jgi:hypothetical protein